jgi:hypothetical protein
LESNQEDIEIPQRNDLRLVGYSDADWGGNIDERKLTYGYAFLLNNGAITWNSKKQSCISLSTMEAEYVACSAAVQEVVWLRRFLQHLEIVRDALDPVTIHCDSTAALAYAKDPKYHGRTNTLTYGITTLETWLRKRRWS